MTQEEKLNAIDKYFDSLSKEEFRNLCKKYNILDDIVKLPKFKAGKTYLCYLKMEKNIPLYKPLVWAYNKDLKKHLLLSCDSGDWYEPTDPEFDYIQEAE